VASAEASLHGEEQRAADLWHQLDGMPQDRRLLLVQNHRRFQTWGLFQYVLTKARLLASIAPREAIGLADLALAIASQPLGVSAALAWDLRGSALAARASALRVLCDFEAAEATFERAWSALENGTGDLLERATAHTLEARLFRDLGRFDEALGGLAAARRIYRRLADGYSQGRTLLQEADLLGVLDPRAGIRKIEEALPLLKHRSEPRLEIMAFGRLACDAHDARAPAGARGGGPPPGRPPPLVGARRAHRPGGLQAGRPLLHPVLAAPAADGSDLAERVAAHEEPARRRRRSPGLRAPAIITFASSIYSPSTPYRLEVSASPLTARSPSEEAVVLRDPHPDSTDFAPTGSPVDTPPCDCGKDPIAALKTMFVDIVQGRRIAAGQDPAQRPVFLRFHGAARGEFVVRPDLPADLKVGVFARDRFPAWVRFSSDLPAGPDFKTTVGVGVKLFEVPGRKLLEPETEATTLDFILQNFDVFFVDTAKDMCEFTYAGVVLKDYESYLKKHPKTAQILKDMAQVVPSVLATAYWAILPFAFGPDRYVKYKLEPETVPGGPLTPPDTVDPYYMHADLRRRLLAGESRFRFLVQLRTDPDPKKMPLDAATERWSEAASPFVHVATLVLPPQDVDARGQAAYGESLAYNIWRTLPEHAPVGTIAEARKVVYRASAELRRNVNGQPLGEPALPRPADLHLPPGKDSRIVRAAIHPAIGVARLGNSPEGYFVGPEVVTPKVSEAGSSRDESGALKRQAACFRIYGYNAQGQVVAELTPDNAAIRWTVHVANKKAAWYQFGLAMDIPEAATVASGRRNPKVQGPARSGLVLDPGPRTIAGKGTAGSQYQFVASGFLGSATPVYLGELRTDAAGRLLFLGGRGVSASPNGSPIWDGTGPGFPNADGWYDDTSDGPVTAEVEIGGRSIPVEPAWVVTAPPNYARDVIGVRTLYDLLYDSYVRAGWLPFPEKISFTRHILPILEHFVSLQWVNKGFAAQYGRGGRNHFVDPAYLAALADPSQTYAELRRQVFNSFRNPDGKDNNPLPWPWVYGDAMNVPAADTPRQNATVSPTQYRFLQLWADGLFQADWDPSAKPPETLAEVPLAERPAMLDRAALHFCLADAFHPGCEVTWPMRHASLYAAPFRIRRRPAGEPEPDYGKQLTQAIALRPGGPLYAQGPGDLTRWMAIPWQMDTAFCRSGYEPDYDPYLPTFWPARVPNQVLAVEEYRKVIDPELPRAERLAAFSTRRAWTRLLRGTTIQQMTQMVQDFGKMGVVEARPGVPHDPDFPPVLFVETLAEEPAPAAVLLRAEVAPPAAAPTTPEEARRARLAEAGWESEEVAADFIRAVRAVVERGPGQ
jgi:hypothetical protein